MRPGDRSRADLLSRPHAGDGERVPRRSARPDDDQAPPLRILVLLGPTGTGKSRVAVEVAEALGGEIVGCDALQIYRGLDAATGKPTDDERHRVPHALVGTVDPRHDYSLAEYVRDADAAVAAIAARGRVPIVVGGTGLYLRGLLKGVVPAPGRDAARRDRLRRLLARFGAARLHGALAARDPGSAARIAPADTQRLLRALELAGPGPIWSDRIAAAGTWSTPGERYDALKIGLTLDRDLLAARLTARVDRFLESGLEEEVAHLLAAGVPESANAFKAIGYREALRARSLGLDLGTERDAIVTATRRYAKRQRTWFRREPGVVWMDASGDPDALAGEIVASWRRFVAC
ncbi:MAG TPA: tRNA (adenosine(37)-N6)-dimethylallyltransferase MiaA [Candidatus Polarisedimenticolaceae bacterium]|nr:tRNA (adenosine(37)-N6)-dimethylallyltransferase MiaA [Candidatus Polarisedimenticolaceae bacterium]